MTATHEVMAFAKPIHIRAAGAPLDGHIWLPPGAFGAVIFPHGRGTERDPVDDYVARKLREARIGTIFIGLLTSAEAQRDARTAALRFDVDSLALRLMGFTKELAERPLLRGWRFGYFGAGYVAAAALLAAAKLPGVVDAIVALDALPDFFHQTCHRAMPSTLALGGISETTLEHAIIGAPGRPVVIGGNHSLEDIAAMSTNWFVERLSHFKGRVDVVHSKRTSDSRAGDGCAA